MDRLHQEIDEAAHAHLLVIGKRHEPFGEFIAALDVPGHIHTMP